MLNVEPKQLVFRDVRLNQPYTTTLCIENPLSAAVEFSIRASSPARYDIKPSKVTLAPRQSISITVRLLMHTFPDPKKALHGQSDSIHIKSDYFDQKVPVEFFMHQRSVTSRSPSPSERATAKVSSVADRSKRGSTSTNSDLVQDLHAQIQVKDNRIAELERLIGNLQSKHPDLERVINARLDLERNEFELKSKQVLDILRRKDEEVESLHKQLEDAQRALQNTQDASRLELEQMALSEGRSRDYWTGRSVQPPAGLGATHRELNELLEQTRKLLDGEKQAHVRTRHELNNAYTTVEELNNKLRLGASVDSVGAAGGRFQPHEWRELKGLREQTLDQSEQIKALVDENSRLRREVHEHAALGEELRQAGQEVTRLRGDLDHFRKKYEELDAEHGRVLESHRSLEDALAAQRVQCQQLRDDLHHAQQGRGSHRQERQDIQDARQTSRVSWQADRPPQDASFRGDRAQDASHIVDGQRFEESVEGRLATATPSHFALHPPQTAQQAIQEKNNLLALYKDRLDRFEEENEQLKSRVLEGQTLEQDLRERLAETETRLQATEQEGRLLAERVERLKSEREASAHEVQDKEVQLRSALEKAQQRDSATAVNDAHLWWAYIWHTLKQQQESACANAAAIGAADGAAGSNNAFISQYGAEASTFAAINPGNADFVPPHDTAAAVHLVRMKENLRAQAIEIAQLRQELIGRKLSYRKELDAVKEQNEHFQREVVRLQAQSRVHRGDKDLKIAELAKTIQTLSVRGDMHAQAAAARQEVEAEKLTNHHLRADVDSYRLMLDEEQRKVLMLRKEVAELQAQIDSSLVVQSVVNVPGVSPAALIELMAGQITQLEADASKSRAGYEEAVQQLRTLQRTVQASSQQRRQSASEASSATPTVEGARAGRGFSGGAASSGPRSRSLSPAPGRRASFASGSSAKAGEGMRRSLSFSQKPFADDVADDMDVSFDGGDSTPGMASPMGSAASWFSGAPHSLIVDGEATPKLVVESLDRAVLAQRVASQEATITELTKQIENLKTAVTKADREHLIAADAADERDRIEWERSLRKADLLQTLLDEARGEVKQLQGRNVELEKSLSDVHSSRLMSGWNNRAPPSTVGPEGSVFYEDAPLMGNHTSDMGSYAGGAEVNFEENQKELESTKILLRERTTQLKILMETLDSLQVAGVKANSKFHSEDEYLFNRRPGDGRAPSANVSAEVAGDLPPYDLNGLGGGFGSGFPPSTVESGWGMQALIKRVVDLTTELTSQCAVASLEARKAEDLELANRRQAKEINKLKIALRSCEESANRSTLQLNSMCAQLQEGDRNHIDAMAALRSENDALTTALREAEAALDAAEIKVSALTMQAEVADSTDFMGWLEMVTLDNQKLVTDSAASRHAAPAEGVSASADKTQESGVFNNKKIGDSTVRELVVGLVTQWKEYVGTVPQMKPLTSSAGSASKLSKPEQRFLQRVTDLVLNANDRASKAELDAQASAARIRQVEHANEVATERLRICAAHLNRYRKRCHAFEKVLSSDRKHQGVKQGKLESVLRAALKELRAKHTKAVDALRAEKRDRMIHDVKRAMDAQHLRKLQAQVAELEARGTATLRARDEAIASLESKLKSSEEAMYSWFKVELPRLVSGLPATEDTLSSYHKENMDPNNFGLDPSPYAMPSAQPPVMPISTHLMSALGMDRTYALSQALCSSKAAMTVQEMRIAGLTEKLSILKERNLTLEGVLVRWKDEIQQSLQASNVPTVAGNAAQMMHPPAPGGDEHDDGMEQYLVSIPGVPQGQAQGHVSAMAMANRMDAAIRQIYTYAESEAQLTAKVREMSARMIELEEEVIEVRGKYEQADARAGEMKALVDVVMSDEQHLKTRATQQLTKIRLNAAQEHAEELRVMRQSYEGEINRLRAELESVAVAVEEAKLTTVDTGAWQRMVAGETDAAGAEDYQRYGTGPRPTPVRQYVPTPPYAQDTPLAEDKVRVKVKSRSRSHKDARKKRKHRKRDTSSSRSSNDSDSLAGSSGSSDTSDSVSDSSSEHGGGRGGHGARRRGRSHSRRNNDGDRSTERAVAAEETKNADSAAAPPGGAAQEYAHTLRAGGPRGDEGAAPRTAPRPRRRKDPMDVRPTPSTNADSSTSVSLSYVNQQQDLAEVQVENLERLLELERRKHEETKFEMAELRHLLEVQQGAFREHLHHRVDSSAAAAGPHAASALPTGALGAGPAQGDHGQREREHRPKKDRRQSVQGAQGQPVSQRVQSQWTSQPAAGHADRDVFSLSTFDDSLSAPSLEAPPPAHQQAHHTPQHRATPPVPAETGAGQPPIATDRSSVGHPVLPTRDPIGSILTEIQREDPGLWPSLSTLVDELMSVLQGLTERTQGLDTRMEARTALAMAARVKIVCNSGAVGRSVAAAAADARATSQNQLSSAFPADRHMKELGKYSLNPAAKADTSEERSTSSLGLKGAFDAHGSVAEDSAAVADSRGRLQALAGRVKLIETDMKDDNIPERHLYLLRDLRMRVLELEKSFAEEQSRKEAEWAVERRTLERRVEENAQLAEQARRGQSESMSAMRQRYEESLRGAEEALESGTRAASQEIERLQSVISQQQQLLHLYEQQQRYPTPPIPTTGPSAGGSVTSSLSRRGSVPAPYPNAQGIASVPASSVPSRAPTPTPPPVPITQAVDATQQPHISHPYPPVAPPPASGQNLAEFLRMQRLVDQTGDHLEHTRQQRQEIEELHARELSELKGHFARFRRAQAEVVRSLEDQLRELHDQQAVPVVCQQCGTACTAASAPAPAAPAGRSVDEALQAGESLAGQLPSLSEAEDVIRKVEFLYRMKTAELESVLGTLSRLATGDPRDTSTVQGLDQSSYMDMSASFDAIGIAVPHLQGGQHGGRPAGQAPVADSHVNAVAREMQAELYHARIAAAEKEIEALHRNLNKERSLVASLRAQLEPGEGRAVNATAAGAQRTGRSVSAPRGSQLFAPRASEEPVLPSQAGRSESAQSGGPRPTTAASARVPTRRGSTGMMDRTSAAAALFPAAAQQAGSTASVSSQQPVSGASSAAPASVAATEPAAGQLDPLMDFTKDVVIPEVKTDNEKTRLLVRRLNEMRRSARVELSRLKEQLAATQSKESAESAEAVTELKRQLAVLKEEKAARAKAMSSYRAAVATGENSVAHWRAEAEQQEATAQRLQRSLASKEALAKDLKSKADAYESALLTLYREGTAPNSNTLTAVGITVAAAPGVGSPAPSHPVVDVDKMSAAELRSKLRQSDHDRHRLRDRVKALQTQVTEQQREIKALSDANTQLRSANERVLGLRESISVKDKAIVALQEKVRRLEAEVQRLSTEEQVAQLEKTKLEKQLQRKLDLERQSRRDLEQENHLMRERTSDIPLSSTTQPSSVRRTGDYLASTASSRAAGRYTATAVSDLFSSSTRRAASSAVGSGPSPVGEGRRSPLPQQRRPPASTPESGPTTTAAAGGTGPTLSGLPSVLEDSAGDISDILAAIGSNPQHVGLGLNPRSSSMSGAYTRNTTGRGSTLDRRNLASPTEQTGATATQAEGASSVERRLQGLFQEHRGSPVRRRWSQV